MVGWPLMDAWCCDCDAGRGDVAVWCCVSASERADVLPPSRGSLASKGPHLILFPSCPRRIYILHFARIQCK